MKNPTHGHVIGISISSVSYAASEELHEVHAASVPEKKDTVHSWMHKLGKKAHSYVQGIRENVALAPKMSKAMKGRIIQAGGTERFFKQAFSTGEGERLLNAYQCYLSTTAGPIAGLLFISSKKIAFHSDKWLKLASPDGQYIRVPYKVLIPLKRIQCATSSQNSDKPNQKYIRIAMVDKFEFWFMGLVSFKKSFEYIQHVISEF